MGAAGSTRWWHRAEVWASKVDGGSGGGRQPRFGPPQCQVVGMVYHRAGTPRRAPRDSKQATVDRMVGMVGMLVTTRGSRRRPVRDLFPQARSPTSLAPGFL